MSSALSIDLRQRVVHAVETGASRHHVPERFGVSLASASRWCGQFAREGQADGQRSALAPDRSSCRLDRLALRGAARHLPSPRETWFEGQLDLDPDRLVFIDETAANTAMARRYGRAPRGERCRMSVPQGHWKTTTVTAALRTSGITASWLLDGAMNGQAFRTYVADVLAPTLQPGDTVVMDNLPAHKVSGIRERIGAAGARLLYLPSYSLDFSPIENAFAKLKALLRSEAARTIPDLWDAIQRALTHFHPTECNYHAAAEHDAS